MKSISELSKIMTEEVFKKAYQVFVEQADKNAVSKKANGERLPLGITQDDNKMIMAIDGGGKYGVAQHYGQGAASKTPYINWFVVSIYYLPDSKSIVMGIEKDRYARLSQMTPLRYASLGMKKTDVAVFFESSKDQLNYSELYKSFISISEQVMKLEGWL